MEKALETLIAQASSGTYPVHGNVATADCLIAFSFGYRTVGGRLEPGLANEDMVAFIEARFARLPVIAEALVAPRRRDAHDVLKIESHAPGVYFNTREVAVRSQRLMEERGWRRAVIVAHPYHLPRAEAVCAKLGIETVVPEGLEAIRFDPDSDQAWTRDAVQWIKKERESLERYRQQGWI